MGHVYKNIVGTTLVALLKRDGSTLKALNIANTKASGAIKVDLYLTYSSPSESDETLYKYYIIKNKEIDFGTNLFLEKNELAYDTTKYDLYITLDAIDSTADIILSIDMNVPALSVTPSTVVTSGIVVTAPSGSVAPSGGY